ncbi:MAG: hypothetical protein GDA65_12270 [Nitrospira sp. CR1.1]|jgi:hypothetical protein|nr:hypothetical protein [Nitrospira sp. CR1.1]
MGKAKPSDIVGKIVDLLTPLSSDERRRVVSASLTLLGETTNAGSDRETEDGGTITTSGKAKTWQKHNNITANQLGQVFHCEDGRVDVIVGEMPGKNKKEKTLNAYVLAGIAQLLISGEAKFTDKDARALCSSVGCYDAPNHATTLRAKGNWFTGSKDKGWILTAPGLKHAATLVKNLSPEQA